MSEWYVVQDPDWQEKERKKQSQERLDFIKTNINCMLNEPTFTDLLDEYFSLSLELRLTYRY